MFNLLAGGLYRRHRKAQEARNTARNDRSRSTVNDWLSSLDSESETATRKKRAEREAQGWIYFSSPDPSTDGGGSVPGGGFVESAATSDSGNTQYLARVRKQKQYKRSTKHSSGSKASKPLDISRSADGHLWYMQDLGRAKVAWHLTPDGRSLDGWRYYYHNWNSSTAFERDFVQTHAGKSVKADRKLEQNKKRRSLLKRQNRARQAPSGLHDTYTQKEEDTTTQRKARRRPTGWVRQSRRAR